MNAQTLIEPAADMLSAALDYAARGWAVFPCVPNEKRPLTHGGYKEGTTDAAQIRAWWTATPQANIGLNLEASGLVAIDADTYKPGCEWAAVAEMHDVPPTLIQRSARGGTHFIYRAEAGARYQSPGKEIDLKRKGYILLHPSTFDGGTYQWQNEAPIAQAPGWLKRPERTLAETIGNTTGSSGRTLAEVEEALQYVDAGMPYVPWNSVLMAIHDEFGMDGVTLADEWSQRAPHVYKPGEVEAKFASFTEGGGVTINTVFDLARKAGADLGQLRHKHFDVTEFFQPVEPEALSIFEDSTAVPAEGSTKRRGLPLMSFAEAAAAALAAGADPLIEGLLDVGAASVVFGPSNVGKTFVVLDMAHAVATGRPWAGRATTRAGVLYLALEGGGGIRKRFAALQKDQAGAAPANFILSCATIDLCNSSDSAQDIIEAAATIPGGCGLIVVDTMARAMNGGDENSAVDVGKFVANVDAIRRATGAHVLIVHHSGKELQRGARGHSSLRAAVDTEIEIAAGTIKNPKQRDHDLAEDLAFVLEPVALGEDGRGRIVKSAVVRTRAPREPEAPALAPTASEERMLDAVRALTTAPAAARPDASANDVAACLKGRGHDIGKDNARKQLDALRDKGWLQKAKRGRYSLSGLALLNTAGEPAASNSSLIVCQIPHSVSHSALVAGGSVPLAARNDSGTLSGMDIFG